MPLTFKQKKFIIEYCKDQDGQRAAVAAGYAPHAARITASKLLRHPEVGPQIAKQAEAVMVAAQVTAETVIEDIRRIQADAMQDNGKGAMLDRQSALKATELLGKTIALFSEKMQMNAQVQGAMSIKVEYVGVDK